MRASIYSGQVIWAERIIVFGAKIQVTMTGAIVGVVTGQNDRLLKPEIEMTGVGGLTK